MQAHLSAALQHLPHDAPIRLPLPLPRLVRRPAVRNRHPQVFQPLRQFHVEILNPRHPIFVLLNEAHQHLRAPLPDSPQVRHQIPLIVPQAPCAPSPRAEGHADFAIPAGNFYRVDVNWVVQAGKGHPGAPWGVL